MAWPSRIVFVRHGESEGNVRSRNERAEFEVPTHKYDLTQKGIKQAEITGAWLNHVYPEGFDIYYTSYYNRAIQTMKTMYPNAKVYEDARLAEAQRGHYHTMTEKEMSLKYPEELARKDKEGLYHYRPFGGENWADIELRIHSFLSTLNRDYSNQKVLIVCHGHWLLLFQRLVHHFSIDEAIARFSGKRETGIFNNTSVTTYRNYGPENSRLLLESENVTPWLGKL